MVFSNLRRSKNKNCPNKLDQNPTYWGSTITDFFLLMISFDIIFFYFTTLTLNTPSIADNSLMISSDILLSMSNMV